MKKLTLALPLACLLSFPSNADLGTDLKNICTIVIADDKSELRKKMRTVQSDYNLSLQDYYTGISCSGNSLIRTAFVHNALEAGTLLIKKMPRKSLEVQESDGATLKQWVDSNNLSNSELAQVLSDRI